MAVQKIKNYKEKKFNFFYKITNDFDDCYYYGIHSTNNMNDGYMGSGKRLCRAQKKHGIEHFIRTVLVFFDTRLEAAQYEFEFLTPEILSDPNCYNICEGGGGGDVTSGMSDEEYEEFCRKIGEKTKGKEAWNKGKINCYSDEAINNMINAAFKRFNGENGDIEREKIGLATKQRCEDPEYREKLSIAIQKAFEDPKVREKIGLATKQRCEDPEYIKKLQESHKGEIAWNKGLTKETDERVAAFSKILSEKKTGTHWYNDGVNQGQYHEGQQPEGWVRGKLSNKGTHWYNNGVIQKYFIEGQQPEGWVRGIIKGKQNAHNKGQHWYNNGIDAGMYFEGEQPEGWVRGMLKTSRTGTKKGNIPANKGMHWYNNGIDAGMYFEGEQPEGWVRGMIKGKQIAWNKGLTKETDERVAKYGQTRKNKKTAA